MNETHFLNIDLDIESHQDISLLVRELSCCLTLMTHHVCEGINRASFESCESGVEEIVNEFINAVGKLSNEARSSWNSCIKREFNFGYQAEDTPRSFTSLVPTQALNEMVSVNAQVGITIYAPSRNFT